jgi:cytochrome c biogenesis protein CcmG/thiol:disulfide interchange protein DsbE
MADVMTPPPGGPGSGPGPDPSEEPDGAGARPTAGGGGRRSHVVAGIAIAVAVVLIGLVVVLIQTKPATDTASTPLLGQAAPVIRTTTLDGKPFDLGSRRGSWVVLNFFSTECGPCVQEHPELLRFATAQEAQPGGAELYTVVTQPDTAGQVKDFFAKNGGAWPVLDDPGGRIFVSFGVAKVPETWVIDPNGVVRIRTIQQVTADELTKFVTGAA